MMLEDHRVLWKSKGVHRREFNDISMWLGVLVCSSKRSGVQEMDEQISTDVEKDCETCIS